MTLGSNSDRAHRLDIQWATIFWAKTNRLPLINCNNSTLHILLTSPPERAKDITRTLTELEQHLQEEPAQISVEVFMHGDSTVTPTATDSEQQRLKRNAQTQSSI